MRWTGTLLEQKQKAKVNIGPTVDLRVRRDHPGGHAVGTNESGKGGGEVGRQGGPLGREDPRILRILVLVIGEGDAAGLRRGVVWGTKGEKVGIHLLL